MATSDAASGREMTVGGVLGRTFAAIGAAPGRFLGISLGVSILSHLLSQLMLRNTPQPPPGAPPSAAFDSYPWGMMIVVWIVTMFLFMLATAVLIRTATALEDGAREEPFGQTLSAALRVLPALIGGSILSYLGIWVGMLLLLVPGIILALMWAVLGPVLVQERVGVIAAFGRSNRLTKGARLRILGLYIVVFAIYLVALFAMGAGVGFSYGMAAAGPPTTVATVLGIVVQSAFLAVWTAVQASLYLELRNWKDGVAGDRLADIFA